MIKRQVIYDASQQDFFKDVRLNKLADLMKESFEENSGRKVGQSEYNSWTTTGEKIKNLVESAELKEIHVSFEYQVPYTQKRIDCLLFGKNQENKGVVVHIELKQWQKVEALETEGNFVETYTGGGNRKVAHPSQQVEGYHNYLLGFVEVFEENQLEIEGCSYCPNYKKNIGEGLFNPKYKSILEKYPIYTQDDVTELAKRLNELLSKGDGFDIFNKFMQSSIKPSKKLLESASKIVENASDFSLLNDQIFAKNVILDKIKKAEKNKEKSVVIVKGGPGTGKTVIALHLLAEMAARKKSIFFSCKSKPLIEAIKHKVNSKNAKLLFASLNPFIPSRTEENQLDILLIDEAHRIGKTSNFQFTKPADRTDMPQVEQLIRCSKTAVFFIDDKQTIRSVEVGKTDLIKKTAEKYGCTVKEVELVSQFRCSGSDNYLDWLESILGHSERSIKFNNKNDKFDFNIVDSPEELYNIIKKKDAPEGFSARIVAGFCWPWSKNLDSNGDLVKDVQIGNFAMPWETHGQVKPPEGYVKWYEWAYKPEGIKQVGCIYTAQGFEFDYIGVIVGPDLKYDKENDCLIGDRESTKDPMLKRGKEKFDEHVKNIYRVLMSRGMKGCYVYFVDKEVEEYFKKNIIN
ncbi:DUF2075 domain-containing protein [Candidatus Woesearchaeota archaeon]|jgi:uncharacterized protein|nr:DUF2075 domain-containing protein [Candidatus Woesearchaeota archaeon]MBT5111504.1 DUF2075 domain-containing protein [Candidatus Woesearchaeota archaeon]MBT5215104.1 DUF2075 domain-containing protein [Candidatus Woesearchaeota archaeon]MBT6941113.1 DUF2075 domain-containing protein [Candidatus Woesearchaeota archaeon]